MKLNQLNLPGCFLKLKLTAILTLAVVSIVFAKTYAQIDLNLKNASMKQVLKALEQQSGYFFLYDNQLLEGKGLMNVSLKDADIKEALDIIFLNQNLEYKIVNKTVTLYPATKLQQVEEVVVKGVVQTLDNNASKPYVAPGILVAIKGTSKAVTTNNNGEFTIRAPKNSTLVISFLGYEKEEILVKESGKHSIILKEASGILKEVVVTGYQIKEAKENQVGSAYTVTAKDLEMRPLDRIDKILEGMVPGLAVQSQDETNASSRPRFSTRIRGESSAGYGISSNEPLWIVDGVPVYTGGTTNMMPGVDISVSPLSYLNPEDIENITVLKDASATTIYGANAANGVILITTKKGSGTSNIGYSFRSGINTIANNQRLKTVNGQQYNSLLAAMNYDSYIRDIDTDWYDVFYRTGFSQNHSIKLSGRTDKNDHYISIGYYNEKPIDIANDMKRISANINFNQKIGKALGVSLRSSSSYNIHDLFNTGSFYQLRPNISPYNADGTYALRDNEGNRLFPSLAEAYQNDYGQKTFANRTNLGLNLRLFDGLTFRTNNGVDLSSTTEDEYRSPDNLTGFSDNGYARRSKVSVLRWISTNTLNYSTSVLDGNLNAVVGSEAQQTTRDGVTISGTNFPNQWIKEAVLAPEAYRRSSSTSDDQSELSYFGRIDYVWKTRYAVNYSIRRDANSNFGSDVRWATFSAAGAAWTISNEEFWKSEAINFLKLKGSYGSNGNSRFSASSARGIYSFGENYTYGNQTGAVMTGGLNNKLKWETTKMLNLGLDFRLFNRVSFAAEYYLNRTHDLIDDAAVSLTSGQRKIYQNIGKLQNKGLEFTINSTNIDKKGGFLWSTDFILALNRSKVLALAEDLDRVYGNSILRVGEDAKALYMVRWAGVDPSTGRPMWYDANGNITFEHSSANRVIVGKPTPDFYGSFTNRFHYKGFWLSFQCLYNVGGKSFSQVLRNVTSDGTGLLQETQPVEILDHWSKPGELATQPMLTTVSNGSVLNSTRYLVDKTYLALKNASLSYDFPEVLLKKINISKASIYLQGDELGMWTPYSSKGNVNTYRNLRSASPVQRMYSLGLNLTL